MKTQIVKTPWPHAIIDSALTEAEWAKLISYIRVIAPSEVPPLANMCTRVLYETAEDPVDLAMYEMMWDKTYDIYKKYFHRLTKNKLVESKLTGVFEFRFLGAGFAYDKIHTDIPEKKMSNVLFVSPDVESTTLGTQLYTGNQPEHFHSNIPWKPNRIFSFVADQENTWHDYANTSEGIRVSVNMILIYK